MQCFVFTTSLVRVLSAICQKQPLAPMLYQICHMLIANEDSKVLSSRMMYWTRVNVISLCTIVPVIWGFRTNSHFCKHFHKIAFKNVFRFLGNVNDFQGRMSWVIVTTSLIHLCSIHVYMKEAINLEHSLHYKDSVRNLIVVILETCWGYAGDLRKTFICLRFSLHWVIAGKVELFRLQI